jgi:hypothetical protein
MSALWVEDASLLPHEYTDFMLCRDVFHCTPAQLYECDADDIIAALAILEAEATVKSERHNA